MVGNMFHTFRILKVVVESCFDVKHQYHHRYHRLLMTLRIGQTEKELDVKESDDSGVTDIEQFRTSIGDRIGLTAGSACSAPWAATRRTRTRTPGGP